MTIQSNLFGNMRAQQRMAAEDRAQLLAAEQGKFLRFESMLTYLASAKRTLDAATRGSLGVTESRFCHHTLDLIPQEFHPKNMRMEGYGNDSGGLKYRAEGIIDSIIDGIASFFRWIGESFSKLFGGSGGESSANAAAGGAAGAANVATATTEAINASGEDEFLFDENHPLFKLMDLQRLDKCREFYTAIASSTKALLDIQKKAIELSKTGSKDYQGDFAKDVVTALAKFSSSRSSTFAKANMPEGTDTTNVFAYPVTFLKSRVIEFKETTIETPQNGDSDKTGQGYTPKAVYIKASEYKGLVDHFAQQGKLFYDALDSIKKAADDYKGLEELVKGWKDMKPEEVKKVGDGLKELNKVAKFVLTAVKSQQGNTDRVFKALRDVAENDLRDAAGKGRTADKAEAEKKAAEANKQGAAVESPIP